MDGGEWSGDIIYIYTYTHELNEILGWRIKFGCCLVFCV